MDGNHLGTSLFSTHGSTFLFNLCTKRCGNEVYGSVYEKFAKKIRRLKNTGRGYHPSSSRVNILFVPQYKTMQHHKIQTNLESAVYRLKGRKKK